MRWRNPDADRDSGIDWNSDRYSKNVEGLGHSRRRRPPHRRKWILWFISLLLMIAVILASLCWWWLHSNMQSCSKYISGMKVAQVSAISTHVPHRMLITLTLYGNNGHQKTETYNVYGDEWRLEGEFISFPAGLNILDLYPCYKLTLLESHYDNNDYEHRFPHSVTNLASGDDNFYKTVHGNSWASPIVSATSIDSGFLRADEKKTYNVFVSQNKLVVELSK